MVDFFDNYLRKKEFDAAKAYFARYPSAAKLSRQVSGFLHSYIITSDGSIFSLSRDFDDKHLLGKGAFGQVKVATDREGTLFAVKIQKVTVVHCISGMFSEARLAQKTGLMKKGHAMLRIPETMPCTEEEQEQINKKFSFKVGTHQSSQHVKTYLVMRYFGMTLETRLRIPSLDMDERYRLAIGLFLKVHKLHHYYSLAHRDLKPSNIMLGTDGLLHLVDFGLSTEALWFNYTHPDQLCGTPFYHPFPGFAWPYRAQITPALMDKIASLSIVHDPRTEDDTYFVSIFDTTSFTQLPTVFRDEFTRIYNSYHKERFSRDYKQANIQELFWASMLIECLVKKELSVSRVRELGDVLHQEKLINDYQNKPLDAIVRPVLQKIEHLLSGYKHYLVTTYIIRGISSGLTVNKNVPDPALVLRKYELVDYLLMILQRKTGNEYLAVSLMCFREVFTKHASILEQHQKKASETRFFHRNCLSKGGQCVAEIRALIAPLASDFWDRIFIFNYSEFESLCQFNPAEAGSDFGPSL